LAGEGTLSAMDSGWRTRQGVLPFRRLCRYRDSRSLSGRATGIGRCGDTNNGIDSRRMTMRVMITGAAGFIGTYLANYSSGLGATVLGIGITEPGEEWAGAAFEHCDVRDYPRLEQLLATFKPERIFHLAAQSYPTRSLRDPQETFTVNVGGTINLFEGLRTL